MLSSEGCKLVLDLGSESLDRAHDLLDHVYVALVLPHGHFAVGLGQLTLDDLVYVVLKTTNFIIYVPLPGFQDLRELFFI